MWQLVINGPGYFDTLYDLPEGVTHLGRADENDIVLSGDLVSRKHARFHAKGDALVLEDLGSRNGSKLNEGSAVGTVPLEVGDVVAIGENSLRVRQSQSEELLNTQTVDTGAGGAVRRFGRGLDIRDALVMTRDLTESTVLRALDNVVPFEHSSPPVSPKGPHDTDESEPASATSRGGTPDDAEERTPITFRWLALMYRVAEGLARADGLQGFLDETTDLVMQRVGATTGAVLLRHSSGVMVPAAVRHSKRLLHGEVPVSDAVIDTALSQGQAIAVADVQDDSRFAERESVLLYGVDQVLCVPIGKSAPFLGVLYLNRDSRTGESVEELLDVCTAIAQLLQTGIEKLDGAPGETEESRSRRALERFFGPAVVERRLGELRGGQGSLARLDERVVTAVHFELVGLAAQAGVVSAERLVELVGEFQRLCTQLVFSFEGTVTGFSSDGADVLFGAPYQRGDDAIRAVRAALTVRAAWERLKEAQSDVEHLPIRVGLTTGRVVAGTTGSTQRLDFLVLGEAPGVAALVAASGEPGQVLVTSKTLAAIGARFDVDPLGERALHGSKQRTPLFEVRDEDQDSGTLSGLR